MNYWNVNFHIKNIDIICKFLITSSYFIKKFIKEFIIIFLQQIFFYNIQLLTYINII